MREHLKCIGFVIKIEVREKLPKLVVGCGFLRCLFRTNIIMSSCCGGWTRVHLNLLIYLDLILDLLVASSAMFVVLLLNFVFSLDSQLLKVELPVYGNLRQHALKGSH